LQTFAVELVYGLFLATPGHALVEAGLPVKILRVRARRADFGSPRDPLERCDIPSSELLPALT
jgi:hypothetical protein